MIRKTIILFYLLLIVIFIPINAYSTAADFAIKARFLSIFPKYITWQNSNDLEEFKITYLSKSSDMYDASTIHSKGKYVGKLPISHKSISKIKQIDDCQILYVSHEFTNDIDEILEKIGDSPILLVTDDRLMNSSDIMINFIYDNSQLKFNINVNQLGSHGFKYNPALLNVALKVIGDEKSYRNAYNIASEKRGSNEKINDKSTPYYIASNSGINKVSKADTLLQKVDSISVKMHNRLPGDDEENQLTIDEQQLELEQERLNKEYENADIKDIPKLMEAEAKLLAMAIDLEKIREDNKKANNLASANLKLLELEKVNSKNVKQKNRTMLIGIMISVFLLFVAIYFLLLSRKLNKKVKKALFRESEVNEELKQSNEEIEAQRDEVEKQKFIIEKAHNDVKDSIIYAKRIQEAILPTDEYINSFFENNFVLYKPKDVVAGDFYWIETYNNKVYIAVADCTGHGVPGAMVSVICSNALTKALLEEGITDAGKILDRSRDIIVNKLARSKDDIKDGMDISLACINLTDLKLEWSGAFFPLYLFRNNDIEITKGDRQPVGYTLKPSKFTTQHIQIQKGDSIYLFSDGYADQFGGVDDKKIGNKKLRELLIESSSLSVNDQKSHLDNYFEKWKSTKEQVDDICVLGVRF